MTSTDVETAASTLRSLLEASDVSVRLTAALRAGSSPAAGHIELLVERCAVEPDFYVRDMLTWALVAHDTTTVVDLLLAELDSEVHQARSQALHTLSKIGRPDTWSAITTALLQDEDDEVARAAWRTAAGLVPPGGEAALAETLATQFNRGGRDVQLSLSRAFVDLGDDAAAAVERAAAGPDRGQRVHAIATQRLMDDPDASFDGILADARREAVT